MRIIKWKGLFRYMCICINKESKWQIKTYSENIYKEKSGNFIATKVDVQNRRILELNGKKAGQVYCETLGITRIK